MSIMWHVKYNPRMGEWRVYDENWYYVAGYKTHAEALAYADHQARTVTLVLPRVTHQREIVTDGYRSFISRQRGGRIWLEHDQAVFCILPDEAKEFAQTILALHYQHKGNQK